VSVFSKAGEAAGRWYGAIPPYWIVAFLALLLLASIGGQARLRDAGQRLQDSSARELRIDELERSLIQSADAQRSFILTGDKSYLALYEKYRADIEPRLERLRMAYADLEDRGTDLGASGADIRNLQVLIGKRLADMSIVLDIEQKQGTPAALALIETSVGSDTGLGVADILERLRGRELTEHQRADRHWYGTLSLTGWITLACTLVSLLIVLLAMRLASAALRRRDLLQAELRDQKLRMEQEVGARTRELADLSTHLHAVVEREKAALARELHDELGGLLVGARMDISWAEQRLAKNDPDLKLRLNRVQQNLAAGVDLKRRIIEELRPTLLDNVGLFAALRWQMKEMCGKAGLAYTESYPDEEPRFRAEASIALFRIAQQALDNIVTQGSAHRVSLSLEIDDTLLQMRIAHDGAGLSTGAGGGEGSQGLASMRHRARTLGGRLDIRAGEKGGTVMTVQIPVANAVLPSDEPAIP
jgi:signal transduction histidine kinase